VSAATKQFVEGPSLPLLLALCAISVLSAFAHWYYSLVHLFRADVKYPAMAKLEDRLKTFRKVVGHVINPTALAESGFFCSSLPSRAVAAAPANMQSGYSSSSFDQSGTQARQLTMTCYDCGLPVRRQFAPGEDPDVVHASLLLKYRVQGSASTSSQLSLVYGVDRLRRRSQAYGRT